VIREDPLFKSAVDHQRAGRLDQALAAYGEVLRAEPTHGEALAGLCQVLKALDRSEEAVPFLDRALEFGIAPDWQTQLNVAWRCFQLGQVDEALALFQEATAGNCPEPAHATIAAIIPGSPQSDNQAILDARRTWAERYLPPARPARFRQRPQSGSAPLRVGYVSSFFHTDNWMKPVWGLINQHDRRCFQIHLFSDSPASQIRHGYRRHPEDRFYDISGLSNQAVADRIENAGVDLLVDLNGYSQMQRLPLLGLRPAPVVVGWFNMYATTGMSCVDYLIGDDVVIPPEEEKYYCEKIVRVPGSYLTFEVGYPVPDVAVPPCSLKERFTFGCLAPLYKITGEVVAAWSRILRGAPDSVLSLRNSALGSPQAVESVRALFHRHDIPPERYRLGGPAEHYEFLQTYNHIDVALDTFPYSGGATTTEAIWQGVPVVTFHGDRWVARTSASILRAANLGQFVGRGLEDYVSMAIRLANSPNRCEFLGELRQNMRSRLRQSPVCDTAGFTRDMERIYRRMVDLREA
jgi:predicted O-linked N-acetylglucosamine transferase (SPINDLY family)